ncbi:hypothetical protein ILYODFUR_035330 [Ilyodon furcidens]|uniref:Uncharacterized protein n=1 Tax=Ilyodon furcidens TaxID=33524 RepID=A0ABV0U0T0_9TELE
MNVFNDGWLILKDHLSNWRYVLTLFSRSWVLTVTRLTPEAASKAHRRTRYRWVSMSDLYQQDKKHKVKDTTSAIQFVPVGAYQAKCKDSMGFIIIPAHIYMLRYKIWTQVPVRMPNTTIKRQNIAVE